MLVRSVGCWAGLGVAFLLVGCGGSEGSGARTFVGKLANDQVRVALVLSSDGKAYGADGKAGRIFVTAAAGLLPDFGLSGSLYATDDGFSTTNPHVGIDPKTTVNVIVKGDDAEGSIGISGSAPDSSNQFSARMYGPNVAEGFYEGDADCGHVGLVVNSGSDAEFDAMASCDGPTSLIPVDARAPVEGQADGTMIVTVEGKQVELRRAMLE